MVPIGLRLRGRAFCALVFGATLALGAAALVPASAHADPFTSNPYTGAYGPPNCTWYAWQRLHDTEHVDLQFSADAGYWIQFAEQPNAAWDEDTGAYVQAQINTNPAPGDVAVLPIASSWANPFHVAYVENVFGDGTIAVSEQSYGDYSPGQNTQPYAYVRHKRWNVADMQKAEQGQARFLHFGSVAPQPVDDFSLVDESTSAPVALNQTVHITLQLANTGTTTWTQADGYQLAEISANCTTCTGSLPAVPLGTQSVAPQQTWKAAFDVTVGPGQICPAGAPGGACTPTTAACGTPCYFLPQFEMEHGTTAFGAVLPLSIAVLANPAPGPAPQPTPTGSPAATPAASPTPTATAPAAAPGDSAIAIAATQSPTGQVGQSLSVYFIVQNSGTTTWSDAGHYALACTSNCMGAGSAGFGGQSVAPGQQNQFNITLTAPTTAGTYHTWWTMEDNGAPFGPNMSLAIDVQGWTPLLQQPAPACANPSGTVWFNPLPASTQASSCDQAGYHLQQTSSKAYAETDLKDVTGLPYDQTTFRAQVKVTFQSPSDANTFGALIVQTPQDPNQAGGFIFEAAPNGHWRLQSVSSTSVITTVAEGWAGAANSDLLTLTVQSGELAASINGQPVAQWSDNLGPNTELGLMVEDDSAVPSSLVQFNAFELDQFS